MTAEAGAIFQSSLPLRFFGAHRAPLQKTINRVHKSQRFLVRQNRLFHLVHYVRECDFVFRIGKGMAAARTGMSKGIWQCTENSSRCVPCIFHEPGGKRRRYLKHAVNAIGQRNCHPFDRFL